MRALCRQSAWLYLFGAVLCCGHSGCGQATNAANEALQSKNESVAKAPVAADEKQAATEKPAAQPSDRPITEHTNWPVFRGDALGTGVARSDLPEAPEMLWKFKAEGRSFESTAAIVNGVVYVGDRGNSDGKLYALDLRDGTKRWEFTAESNIISPAAVNEGRVFFGDMDGKFYAVDTGSGKKLWDFTAQAEIDGGANFWKDKVLFGSQDATLYCLDPKSGELAWKFAISDQIRCTPTVVEDRAFVAGCDSKLHIIDLTKGAEMATVPIESQTGVTPAVHGEQAYVGTQSGVFFAINWKTAAITWTNADPAGSAPYDGSPAVFPTLGLVLSGGQGKRMKAFDLAKGEPLWSYTSRGKMESSPVIAGTRAFFGGHDGRLVAVDLKTGKEGWKRELTGKIIGSPAVADGRLIIGTDAGELYCFGAK